MKNKKLILLILLISVIALAVLSGCSVETNYDESCLTVEDDYYLSRYDIQITYEIPQKNLSKIEYGVRVSYAQNNYLLYEESFEQELFPSLDGDFKLYKNITALYGDGSDIKVELFNIRLHYDDNWIIFAVFGIVSLSALGVIIYFIIMGKKSAPIKRTDKNSPDNDVR